MTLSGNTPKTALAEEMDSATFELLPNETVHDEAFVVRKSRMGLYNSILLDGTPKLCALTEEACIKITRWDLKTTQDNGWNETNYRVIAEAYVGGKL